MEFHKQGIAPGIYSAASIRRYDPLERVRLRWIIAHKGVECDPQARSGSVTHLVQSKRVGIQARRGASV